jgi:Ca-activated chloride channel homolog
MKGKLFGWVAVGLAGMLLQAGAAGLIIVEDPSFWPGPNPPRPLPPQRPHPFAPLEVRSVQAKTKITDQVAVTSIDQEFYNPNSARLEGTFIFPIPKGAHLDKFSMDIDGRQVEAELLSADKARGIYEEIVRKMKDPALLEYAGRDIFKARIFPIEPNSRKRIKLSYTQLLKADDGLVSFVLPLSAEKFSCQPIKNVAVKVEIQTKRPLKSIYSPSHSVEIRRDGSSRATAGYEASDIKPDTDFTLYFAPEKDEIGLNLLTHKIGSEDGYFLLLASPGLDVKESQVLMKDVVFVLDTSGSMAGKKLEQAKKALLFCVENLNEGDRFEILRFSTEVEPLFNQLREATTANRSRAETFAKDLKAIGGTAIDDALRKALEFQPHQEGAADSLNHKGERPFVVIFLTDGCPTVGTTDEDQIVGHVKKENQGRTRVFCFGIGTDVNTHLLDKITEETHSFSQYVLPEEDLEIKVSSFFAKIKDPVLSHPSLQFTGDIRTAQLYPSTLPDLFKGEQLVLVGRYSGRGDSAMILEGTVNGSTKRFTYEGKFSGENSDNEFIPRLWATRRVGYLLDEIRLHGENSELRDEVTDLARKYGIVTPYTAYLIVEDEKQRNVPDQLRSMDNLQRDQAAHAEAGRAWHQFKDERGGDSAVAGALSSLALRSAEAPAAATAGAGAAFQRRYGLATSVAPSAAAAPAENGPTRLVQYSQQSRFVSGKTFFQNNDQWVDSAIQRSSAAKRVRVQLGSPEYFTLLSEHPQAASWLALGQRVQFLLDGTVYEIVESR